MSATVKKQCVAGAWFTAGFYKPPYFSHDYKRFSDLGREPLLFPEKYRHFPAWTKVHKKRYFYDHPTIDGTSLDYLGPPIRILRGRLAAAPLFFTMLASPQKTLVPKGLQIPSPLKCIRDNLTNNVRF